MDDGTEFWSARDLMPHLGYRKWERLGDAIERTEIAITNSGNIAGQHIRSRQREDKVKAGFGERTVTSEDYELTRFGCYILFMNADPRKAEVAAAQSYFAVKTREAETRKAPELSRMDLIQIAMQAETERLAHTAACSLMRFTFARML
ncbi:MAG: BRO family protein [Corynebacterium variabile]|uniref:BRO family protein n=1 Tax=Corynebacterium variabile TaxID=1727 RepID=UPI003F9A79C5